MLLLFDMIWYGGSVKRQEKPVRQDDKRMVLHICRTIPRTSARNAASRALLEL
ncbi:MAG: hypothetical protein JRD87_10640 [Deltaproteobacteria bacterium]|nr:hypothetical protein [Deltaproteobacteria bacterium]MBW2711673.1 hypothetical protein [Deltaproteobacteria bacterium]